MVFTLDRSLRDLVARPLHHVLPRRGWPDPDVWIRVNAYVQTELKLTVIFKHFLQAIPICGKFNARIEFNFIPPTIKMIITNSTARFTGSSMQVDNY